MVKVPLMLDRRIRKGWTALVELVADLNPT
jgi:hypothetical protein